MDIYRTNFPIHKTSEAPEDVIFKYIEDNIDDYIDIDKTIIDFNIHELMRKGTPHRIVQSEIDKVLKDVERPIFLINYDKSDEYYNFGDNSIIFTPESTYSRDNFFGIPRQSLMVDDGTVYDRNILFSFRGADWTHPTRQKLISLYPDTCIGYKGWGVTNNDPKFKLDYIKQLKQSIFSLCPRGYGRTSFRLYESLMFGSIPIIISDDWKPPLYNVLDWNEFSVTVNESDIDYIPEILTKFSDEYRDKMSIRAMEVYEEYFSGENMYKCFELMIRN